MPACSPPFSTMLELLQTRSQQAPESTAFTFLGDGENITAQLTYGQLDTRARAIAAELQRRCATGERAILLYHSGLDYISAFWGCLYAGVIAVPAYPPHPKRPMTRLKAIADDASAKFALTDSALYHKLATSEYAQADLAGVAWVATDIISSDIAKDWLEPSLSSDSLAFLQYTSGSTSTPKGVMISHGNLLWTLEDLHRAWDHTSASVMVTWLPIFHDLGLIYGILTPTYVGFPCYFMPPATFLGKPARWLQAITRFRGTHTAAPNFAYELCAHKISAEQKTTIDLSSLRMALNAAEPIRRDTLETFTEMFATCGFSAKSFAPGYGLAEASVKVSAERVGRGAQWLLLDSVALEKNRVTPAVEAENSRAIIGCGESAIGAQIRIVHPDLLTLCDADCVGEIWVKSRSVAQGYWNRPEATHQTFEAYLADGSEGPFLRTGDLGFYRDGQLYITGRLKDLLIIRGRNHYPQDIEMTIERAHPALRSGCGAAFAVTASGEEQLVVFQELERTHLRTFDAEEIFTDMRHAVAREHELDLHAIVLLRTGSIPKTSSGKIQRQASKQLFLSLSGDNNPDWHLAEWRSRKTQTGDERPEGSAEMYASPKNPTEAAIAQIWSDLLEVKHVGIHDDFFKIGGSSLLAAEMISLVSNFFNVDLPLEILHEASTVEELSEHVLSLTSASRPVRSRSSDLRRRDNLESRSATESHLVAICERFLGRNPIGIQERLEELKGESKVADRIFQEVRNTFPVFSEGLPISMLRDAPTIEVMARMIDDAINPPASLLVTMQSSGEKPPLILVHAGGGYVFFYRAFISHLGRERPVYAIRAETEADGLGLPFANSESVEQVAERYLEEVKKVRPRGPYSLGGACMGGAIAYEMARQLEAAGEEVFGPVLTFDAPLLNNPHSTIEAQNRLLIAFGLPPFESRFSRIHRRFAENLDHARRQGLSKGASHLFQVGAALARRQAMKPLNGAQRLMSTARSWDSSRFSKADQQSSIGMKTSAEIQTEFMAQSMAKSCDLLKKYVPGGYQGRVVVFQAKESPDCAVTWAGLPTGGIEVHTMPGEHLDMMEDPTAQTTASLVNRCLDEVFPADCKESLSSSFSVKDNNLRSMPSRTPS